MAIKIGHASISENGNAGWDGKAKVGDQTGRELCIREWYSKSWGFVLRYPDANVRENMAKACEAGCANNNIGYDQSQRNTAHTKAKKVNYNLSKVGKSETDCSAFMTLCAIAGGVKKLEYSGNAPSTSTMEKAFKDAGFTVLRDKKYLESDAYLLRGDILVKPGSHTVMALENGSKAVNKNSTPKKGNKPTSGGTTYEITARTLNIRSGADTSNKIVGAYKKGAKVKVTKISNGWGKTDKGWISLSYAKKC